MVVNNGSPPLIIRRSPTAQAQAQDPAAPVTAEAVSDAAAADENVTQGAAAAKKPRIIKKVLVEKEDHTVYRKTWTGSGM